MPGQNRNLPDRTKNKTIRHLQASLRTLGYPITDADGVFGASTRQAVEAFQKDHHLAPTGTVDRALLDLIAQELAHQPHGPKEPDGTDIPAPGFAVHGSVTHADGRPAPNLTVKAFDRDLRSEALLGQAVTDNAGAYAISYTADQLHGAGKTRADLLVRAFDRGGKEVASSGVTFNAPVDLTIDLVFGNEPYRGPAEYSQVEEAVKPYLGQMSPAALKPEEIDYLAAKTGFDAALLTALVQAARLAQDIHLPPVVFYGLIRRGQPADLTSMLRLSRQRLQRILESAAKQNLIPEAAVDMEAVFAGFEQAAVQHALAPSTTAGEYSLGDVLGATSLARPQQETLLKRAIEFEGLKSDFWPALRADPAFGEALAGEAQFTLQLGRLTGSYLPLVNYLVRERQAGRIADPRDLARLDAAGWRRVLTTRQNGQVIGAPPDVEGQTDDERIQNYAASLAGTFERLYPTAAVAGRLTAASDPAQTGLIPFLGHNPDFDLGATNVDQFLPNSNLDGVADVNKLSTDLKRMQRLYRLVPADHRIDGISALSAAGLTSAQGIKRLGKARFVKTFAGSVGGVAAATQIYNNASHTAAAALTLFGKYGLAQSAPWVLGPNGSTTIPNWETLFGSLDYCACEDCRSVYSPAAYFVDLLAFLDQYETEGQIPPDALSRPTALDRLLGRRPDLAGIELTCENTNTLLPYVDLFIEIAENAVVGESNAYQTGWTETELASNAEHLNPAAYDRDHLAGQVYPFEMPFNVWLAEARIFIEHLGVSLYDVMDSVQRKASSIDAGAAWTGMVQRAAEYLQISPLARRIITGDTKKSLATLWNATGKDLLAYLSDVPTFLNHAGLSYEQLLELLSCRFINPVRGVIIISPPDIDPIPDLPGPGKPPLPKPPAPGIPIEVGITITLSALCTVEGATLNRLTEAALDRIHRFLRLQRALDWTMRDLDRVLTAVGDGAIDEAFLVRLANVKQLLDNDDLPLAELLSWWSTIETTTYEQDEDPRSLYEQLFLNNAVISPVDEAFRLNDDQAELAVIGTISAHIPTIVAALGITSTELTLITTSGVTNDLLNLANLSALYRHVSMANTFGLSIPDLLALKALTGIDPFNHADTSQTLKLSGYVDAVRAAAFSISALDYLLRHVYDPEEGVGLSDEAIDMALDSLRAGLDQIDQEYAVTADPTGVLTASRLASLLPPEALPEAIAITAGSSGLDVAAQTTFVQNNFALFLDAGDAVARLVEPGTLSDVEARYAYVLAGASNYLAQTARQSLIAQHIASDFALELSASQALLVEHLPKTLADLQALAQADDPGVDEAARQSYIRLHKTAMVLNALEVTVDELPWLFSREYDFGWYDLRKLPVAPLASGVDPATFADWTRLVSAFSLRDKFAPSASSLFEVLAAGYSASAVDQVWDEISAYTGWARADVETLAGTAAIGFTFPHDYRTVNYLIRLDQAFVLLDQIDLPADIVVGWEPTDDVAGMQATAQSIKQAARAHYDETTWLTAAPPLQNTLREKQRAALVTYLVATLPGIEEPDDLFEHFLIDSEMDACMKTSRIKQAISSVQLFTQRCLMGLEPDINLPEEAAACWEWMKQYTLWEAARKIFLYPENWIEPELRDDTSPFFEDLASELLQSDLTDDSAEVAFRHYLEQLDVVDHLEVRSLYHQLETTDDGEQIDVLHVLARTLNAPYVHYYRQRVDNTYWTAWEQVGVSVAGDHEFLVMRDGLLYLYMPVFTMEGDEGDLDSYWIISLKWSKYQQGQWTGPQEAEETLIDGDTSRSEDGFFFRTMQDDDDLLIVVLWINNGTVPDASFEVELEECPAFRISCGEKVEIDDETYHYWYDGPSETVIHYMTILEHEEAGGELALPWVDESITGEYDDHYLAETVTVLNHTPGRFELVWPHQYDYYAEQDAFFYHGIKRVFYVRPAWTRYVEAGVLTHRGRTRVLSGSLVARSTGNGANPASARSATALYNTADSPLDGYTQLPEANKKLQFAPFHHPYVCDFVRRLNQGGVPALLQRATQSQSDDYFGDLYDPNVDVVDTRYPLDEVAFDYGGAYSTYNAEIFFHVPLLIAERLRQNQRFEEAQQWYHYIFNPLAGVDGAGAGPERYWIYYPFYLETTGETTLDMMLDLAQGDSLIALQVEQWRKDPFQPHALARLRPQAYQKSVVMKYIQNLIDWGDQLFTQDTIETINEATQLYVLAANILGPKPDLLSALDAAPMTFAALRDDLDAFSNALVELENYVGEPVSVASGDDGQVPTLTLYFSIPPNDNLLALWDTVADRLFKIRHCMNIEGTVRQLPLFEPPIDPGLLVRAAALGIDLSSVLADLYAPLPAYRFQVMLPKAVELCNEVRSLGAALLAALEKKDAEALSLLRASQETQLLEAIRQVKQMQIDEANESIAALESTQAMVEARQAYYAGLIASDWNDYEDKQQQNLATADTFENLAQALNLTAASEYLAGALIKGGFALKPAEALQYLGDSSRAVAGAFEGIAAHFVYRASLNSILGNHERQTDEWSFQRDLAADELEQVAKQLLAAEIRRDIAARELDNHDKQIANAQAAYNLMQTKFTNQALYDWMISQISVVYFQSYQLAYDLARRAEKAYQHELALATSAFVQFGYWDSLKKGLLSGEKLSYDLRRMEISYLEENRREYELTRHVSLRQLDPLALLTLKATGACETTIPEWLFDLDNPGHYMRRLKNVSVSIPSITGPYTSVNCTLSLLKSTVRKSSLLNGSAYARQGSDDDRFTDSFGTIQSIVTSSGNADSGLFETNLHDERYLPFEGAGAESTWRLELPTAFRQFDYNTISDVILHVRYTARPGGTALANKAIEDLQDHLRQANESGLALLLSLRHDFSTEWLQFLAGSGNFTATVKRDYFPYFTQGRDIRIDAVQVHAIQGGQLSSLTPSGLNLADLTSALAADGAFALSLAPDDTVLVRDPQTYAFVRISYSVASA